MREVPARTDNDPPLGAASREALRLPHSSLLRRLVALGRQFRHWASAREWAVRLLGLPRSAGTEGEPGLVMIQIDGLARAQLERALQTGRMPFLGRLLARESYRLYSLYSGLPGTTPAVQGELFYGAKGAVPAFRFRDHRTGQVVKLDEPAAAARLQEELSAGGPGLLEGGSAYCDIFSGGAAECHFCATGLSWRELPGAHSVRTLLLDILAPWSILRTAALLGLEFLLGLVDCVRGLSAGRGLWQELRFLPRRLVGSILLRKVVTRGVELDVTRGLPVVHANFLGYDEQAHQRGPGSAFAHRSLRGIDRAIKRIWDAAHRSVRRDYHVWIYSDHGQEATEPYRAVTGKIVQEAVTRLFEGSPDAPAVVAVGPVGHVYCPVKPAPEEQDRLARRLVVEAEIPLVLAVGPDGVVRAWNRAGRFRLPEEADQVLGSAHPFLEEAGPDLEALCRHPDAGDFTICGWRASGRPLSFVTEDGAHGGPGPEETGAFALLPGDAPLPEAGRGYLRPLDLRQAARHLLGAGAGPAPRPARRGRGYRLRVLTYNVHGCLGMDGKLSPGRIARVIGQGDPDVVALQEVDVGRARSGEADQAYEIARRLQMDFHFYPAFEVGQERYGNAVLSRLPLRLVRATGLPQRKARRVREPRGALWVAIDVGGRELHLITTHLGLDGRERLEQVRALLGPEWLSHPECVGPVILCGDLNSGPSSAPYRLLRRRLRDAQLGLTGRRPQKTWISGYPVTRLDHVFVGGGVRVLEADVLRTRLAAVASDHLPLVVEVAFQGADAPALPARHGVSGHGD